MWKNEKVNKWEMLSCTHACKVTDSPSSCLDGFENRKAIAFSGARLGRSSALFPKPRPLTQPYFGALADNFLVSTIFAFHRNCLLFCE